MNSANLQEHLRAMGIKARLKPYQEAETGAVCLEARRPAGIIAGKLAGAMFDLYDCTTFRIWTPQVKKARACAARYGLRIRCLDREAELFIPANLADALLPVFGARIKRELSAAAKAHLKAIGYKKHTQEGSKTPPGAKGHRKTP